MGNISVRVFFHKKAMVQIVDLVIGFSGMTRNSKLNARGNFASIR